METHPSRSGFFQTLLRASALCLVGVFVLSGRSGGVLLCYYRPLQARGGRCTNMTTECRPHERCFSGWRRYGPVSVLAAQGCVSPELCGSNHTVTLMGFDYQITYACCCHDRCNEAPAPGNRLKQLFGVTVRPTDNITAGDPLHCPDE
ncbi:protein Bouncer-like isoform X2 [Ctenopharyngodon idella]|uniref:protein Bouncer-like isoform X2 n=1 Tax=Ctenopharyngodon idella TaxID=7959 RepID=UPI0022309E7C|nr:protein Bouncer-like isoform X2 [Ctenopharyngodon idella]